LNQKYLSISHQEKFDLCVRSKNTSHLMHEHVIIQALNSIE